jgi:hypothetical protein
VRDAFPVAIIATSKGSTYTVDLFDKNQPIKAKIISQDPNYITIEDMSLTRGVLTLNNKF